MSRGLFIVSVASAAVHGSPCGVGGAPSGCARSTGRRTWPGVAGSGRGRQASERHHEHRHQVLHDDTNRHADQHRSHSLTTTGTLNPRSHRSAHVFTGWQVSGWSVACVGVRSGWAACGSGGGAARQVNRWVPPLYPHLSSAEIDERHQ